MSKSLHVQSYVDGRAYPVNATDFCSPFADVEDDNSHSSTQAPISEACTVSNAYVVLSANSFNVASNWRIRKNDADTSILVSIGAGQTGQFEDTTNTASFAANDDVNWRHTSSAGSGTVTCTHLGFHSEPDSSTDTVTLWGCNSAGDSTLGASVTTHFPAQGNRAPQATESRPQVEVPTAATAKSLTMNTGTNTRSDATTIRSRVDGANGGLSISVGASQTGQFEDTSGSDSLSGGELFNYQVVTGAGTGNFTVEKIGCSIVKTDSDFFLTAGTDRGVTILDGNTAYFAIAGNLEASGANDAEVNFATNLAIDTDRLSCDIETNTTTGTNVVQLRKNSVDANQSISIGSGQTGIFRDSSNTDSFEAGDDLGIEIDVPLSTGQMRVKYVTLEATETVAATGGPKSSLMLMGVGF